MIQSHRFRTLLFLLLIVIAPFFFIGGPDWASSPLYRAAWNLGHVLFFAALTLFYQVFRGIGGIRQAIVISGAVFMLGLAIELLQSYVGREVGWGDVLRNLTGAWLVLAWRQPVSGGSRARGTAVWTCRGVTLLLLVAHLLPVVDEARHQVRLAEQMPLLADFDDAAALRYWSGDVALSREYSLSGAPALAIQLGTERYSGASLNNLHGDWSAYRHFEFRIYNPGSAEITLTLRINDLQHDRGSNAYSDRFNRRITVAPGWSKHQIDLEAVADAPATRRMNMDNIRRLMLFTSGLSLPQTIYLDKLQLANPEPDA